MSEDQKNTAFIHLFIYLNQKFKNMMKSAEFVFY